MVALTSLSQLDKCTSPTALFGLEVFAWIVLTVLLSFLQVEQALEEQFVTGRVLASISSRPGQCGRCDGYVLEGKELEFYMKKIKAKKGR